MRIKMGNMGTREPAPLTLSAAIMIEMQRGGWWRGDAHY